MSNSGTHGLMAEFEGPNQLIAATSAAHKAGFRDMDAYSPMPIEEVCEAMELHHNGVPRLVFCGGVVGMLGGYGLAYWSSVIEYPLNIGGRPLHSWPAFLPITFETTVLVAAFAAVFGMFALNGLPRPYHPVFNVDRFSRASEDRFFLCIEATDPKYDAAKTREFLEGLNPYEISEVQQ